VSEKKDAFKNNAGIEGNGEWLYNGYGISFWHDEAQELDIGDIYIKLCKYVLTVIKLQALQ
jgi:hypothetical protein